MSIWQLLWNLRINPRVLWRFKADLPLIYSIYSRIIYSYESLWAGQWLQSKWVILSIACLHWNQRYWDEFMDYLAVKSNFSYQLPKSPFYCLHHLISHGVPKMNFCLNDSRANRKVSRGSGQWTQPHCKGTHFQTLQKCMRKWKAWWQGTIRFYGAPQYCLTCYLSTAKVLVSVRTMNHSHCGNFQRVIFQGLKN